MDRTLGHNGTAIHDVKAVAHVEAEVQVLFDQKNAELVALTQLFDRLTDLVDDVRLDTLGRFVKQKDFGIEPIVVGGGAVKVKNELRVEFDIMAKP